MEFWNRKFASNIERDNRVREEIADYGITSIVLWECEISPERLVFLVKQIRKMGNE